MPTVRRAGMLLAFSGGTLGFLFALYDIGTTPTLRPLSPPLLLSLGFACGVLAVAIEAGRVLSDPDRPTEWWLVLLAALLFFIGIASGDGLFAAVGAAAAVGTFLAWRRSPAIAKV
ncbi:MAG: hypothetical protein ACT4PT_05560 [Methanobacteriota archaeon]